MKKRTSIMTKSIIFCSFFLLVSIISFNVYQNFINTPKKIFMDAIKSLADDYKNFNKIENTNYEFLKNDFVYDGNIHFNVESSLKDYIHLNFLSDKLYSYIDFLDNLDISYNLQKQDDKLLLSFNNKYKEDKLSWSYYGDNNNHYIKLDSYSDNYININSLFEFLNNNFDNIIEINNLKEFIFQSFINHLDDKYFYTEKDSMVLDNDNIDVTKNVLVLTREHLTIILKEIISDLKNNEEIYNKIIDLYPAFANFDVEIADNIDNDFAIFFNTYTNKNELIKYEIELNNINSIVNTKFNNIIITFWKDKNIIDFSIDSKNIFEIKFLDDNKKIDFYLNESKILSLNINSDEYKNEILLNSNTLFNTNFILNFSEIFDKNILENYDKIEDKLLVNFSVLGFDILKIELKNVADIYDKSNIQILSSDFENSQELFDVDLEKIKLIILNFISKEEIE